MDGRRPLAPNNRNGVMSAQFLASLESKAVSVKYPKSKEEPTTKSWAQPGRQTAEGFGGGYRVTR